MLSRLTPASHTCACGGPCCGSWRPGKSCKLAGGGDVKRRRASCTPALSVVQRSSNDFSVCVVKRLRCRFSAVCVSGHTATPPRPRRTLTHGAVRHLSHLAQQLFTVRHAPLLNGLQHCQRCGHCQRLRSGHPPPPPPLTCHSVHFLLLLHNESIEPAGASEPRARHEVASARRIPIGVLSELLLNGIQLLLLRQ